MKMNTIRNSILCLSALFLTASLLHGQDLSKYRDFSLGIRLPELSSRVDLRPLQTKLIQKHPAVIQELTCGGGGWCGCWGQAGSVGQRFFGFGNGELFRIWVAYDHGATRGLTAEDMV